MAPQTQVQAPVRSLDQRMEALKRANDIRVKRAQLKKDLKSGSVSIEQILGEPPEYVSAGKGTLIQLVLPRFPELAVAVSATTRAQRPGEENGVHYWFLNREDFQAKIDAGEFLEYVDYVGNLYGTLRSEIDRLRSAGRAP